MTRHARCGWLAVVMVFAAVGTGRAADTPSSWPRWRGPRGDGHSTQTVLPGEWSGSNVAWKTPLPGTGQSSPIIWGDRIFLTSALEKGNKRVAFCVDRNSGKLLWEHTAWTGPPGQSHSMNGWASASCATDGKHVYAFFAEGGGIHCYSPDGKPVWHKEIGTWDNRWGSASCPVLSGDAVIQVCDSDNNAFITALDRRSGKEIWKTKRDNFRGWSTPILVRAGDREELVVNGHSAVCAYDPKTGRELWRSRNRNGRGTPTVTPGHGLLFVTNGVRPELYAVKPGGQGDVTDARVAWRTPRTGRDIPSPIVVGDYLLVVGLRGGILGCYEARTGKELWMARLGTNFSASPVSWGGLAFFLNEAGVTYVVRPGTKPDIVRQNRLEPGAGEIFRASITPLDGQLFIRSNKVLYCIGRRTAAGK